MASESQTSAGFRTEQGRLRVRLPACISVTEGAEGKRAEQLDIATLFRVLHRYHSDDQRERSTDPQVRGLQDPTLRVDDAALHWIECALELLDDYAERGLLRYEIRTTSRTPRGRIDWRTTVRREFACVSDDSSLYLAPFRTAIEAQDDHPLTELHAATVRQLRGEVGTSSALEVPGPGKSVSADKALQTLSRERNRVFRDRDRRVVRLLEGYWLDVGLGRSDGFRRDLLWTDQFEFVWQRMLEAVLGAGRANADGLPKGRYSEDGIEYRGLDLRPDLIVDAASGTRIIFDAKYYTSGAMPSSADVLKQLAYAYFSSSRWGLSLPQRVVNVFLLPGDSPREPVRLSGRHRLLDLSEDQRRLPLAEDIWLFRIDYRSLAGSYLARSHWKRKLKNANRNYLGADPDVQAGLYGDLLALWAERAELQARIEAARALAADEQTIKAAAEWWLNERERVMRLAAFEVGEDYDPFVVEIERARELLRGMGVRIEIEWDTEERGQGCRRRPGTATLAARFGLPDPRCQVYLKREERPKRTMYPMAGGGTTTDGGWARCWRTGCWDTSGRRRC